LSKFIIITIIIGSKEISQVSVVTGSKRNAEANEDEICRACSTKGEKRNACRILVGKPEGKRPLRRPRHRWVDNIKMDVRDIGWGGMEWIDLDMDHWRALVSTVINLQAPQNPRKFLSSYTIGGF
jgi:hypothetical protein